MPVSWRGRRAGQCLKNWKKMEMKTWQKAVKAKMASQMVNRIRKMVLVQKRMRTVEIAALDRTRMKKLPKMIAVQVSQKMTARRVRLSLKQSQRISW